MLTGTVPSSFATASQLEDFYMSNNKLTGTIPDIPSGSLPALTELLFDGNNLIGNMPASICDLRNVSLEDLWADCAPPVEVQCDLPDCCTRCFPSGNES